MLERDPRAGRRAGVAWSCTTCEHTSGLLGSDGGGRDGRRRRAGVRVLRVRAIDDDARSTCGRSLFLIDRCLRTAEGGERSAMEEREGEGAGGFGSCVTDEEAMAMARQSESAARRAHGGGDGGEGEGNTPLSRRDGSLRGCEAEASSALFAGSRSRAGCERWCRNPQQSGRAVRPRRGQRRRASGV